MVTLRSVQRRWLPCCSQIRLGLDSCETLNQARARIETVPDDSWDGALGELHPRVVDPVFGRVDNVLAVHSLNPRSMAAHLATSGPSPP